MHAQTFIKFSIAIPPTGMFLGRWEEDMQALREHAKLHTDSNWSSGLNTRCSEVREYLYRIQKRGANFCTQPYLGNPSADQKFVHDNNALYVLLYITAYLDISYQKMPTTQLRIVTSC